MPELTRSLAIAPVLPPNEWRGFLRNHETFVARYAAPETPAPTATHFTVGLSSLATMSPTTAEEVIFLSETASAIGRSTRAAET